MTPSDDECIALAMLHGATFSRTTFQRREVAYLNEDRTDCPVANAHIKATGYYFYNSVAAAARDYCEYHKLIGEPHERSPELRSGHAA
jgi:hypothetical protein